MEQGVKLCSDPFLFSLAADCSQPMPPDHFTKRVGVLKGHLGIEDKRPDVMALEGDVGSTVRLTVLRRGKIDRVRRMQ